MAISKLRMEVHVCAKKTWFAKPLIVVGWCLCRLGVSPERVAQFIAKRAILCKLSILSRR